MKNIWFTSDTHYGHVNITGAKISNWGSGYRNFNSVSEMNSVLVDGINKYVKKDDILYHLGDWSFGGAQNILKFRNLINCENIHIILGNHDQHITDKTIIYDDGITFNPMDIFSSVQNVLKLKISKRKYIFLSHYAHRVWEDSHKGVIHLYGHSHGNISDYGKSMDVGVDVAFRMFGEYRPFNIDEIFDIMSNKEIEYTK